MEKVVKIDDYKGSNSIIIKEGRSISKISKELSDTVSKMKELAPNFGKLEGKEKDKARKVLLDLTSMKKELVQELDDAVLGKDRNVELELSESVVNEAANFKLRWLKDTPELADILRKDILKLWKKHKLDDKKQNRPEGGKWGASYTFRKGHNKKNYIDTTELQWNRAEGPRRTAEDDENGGYEHILKFVRDVREVLSKNGYESKFLPTGGPYRHDHLAIWHNKDVEKSGNGFAANESVVNEAKFDKKKLMKAVKKDDGFIKLGNGEEYIIYKFDNGNDDNDEMWNDKTIIALDSDGGEHEIEYSDIVSYDESVVGEGVKGYKVGPELKDFDGMDFDKAQYVISNDSGFSDAVDADDWKPMLKIVQNSKYKQKLRKFLIHSDKDMENFAKWLSSGDHMKSESVDEARKIQTKRKYTESHPNKTVGFYAKARNKILEAIKDGKITQDEFDNIIREYSKDGKRWLKRNGKMFIVKEEGISLSKFGKRILKGITINEANVNPSGYANAGNLGYNDQFIGRRSLSYTLSVDLGMNPKHEFSGGDWLGFDHVSMYVGGGKKEGTILDDALTGKYTYDKLKLKAAQFLGIKLYRTSKNPNESIKMNEMKSNIKKKWASTNNMMDDLREFILDAKDAGGEDLVKDIHDALKLITNFAEGELKESKLYKNVVASTFESFNPMNEESSLHKRFNKMVNKNLEDVAEILIQLDKMESSDGDRRSYYEIHANQIDGAMDIEASLNDYSDKKLKDILKMYESVVIDEAKQRKLSSSDMDKIEQVVDDAETAFMRLPSSETWMEDYNTDDMVKILTDYYNRSEYRNKKLQYILDLFDVKKQSDNIYGWKDEMQAESNAFESVVLNEKKNLWEETGDKDDIKFLTGFIPRMKAIYSNISPAKYNLDDFEKDLEKLARKIIEPEMEKYGKAKKPFGSQTSEEQKYTAKLHSDWLKAAEKTFKHVKTWSGWKGSLNSLTSKFSTFFSVLMDAAAGDTESRGYKVMKNENVVYSTFESFNKIVNE